MKVLLHESWGDVQNLSDSWNRLLAESASNTVFLSWEWVEAWWKNYGSDRPLFVLSAWEGNSLEGLAPFFVERLKRWGSEWACLRLVGDGSRDSDYLDCIARRGREHEVIAAFVEFLESHANRWSYLEFALPNRVAEHHTGKVLEVFFGTHSLCHFASASRLE